MTPDRAIEWMAENGRPGYRNRVRIYESLIDETIGDAGRYWQFCDFTVAKIAAVKAEIEDIKRDALDRYEDWASDPLP